MRKYYTCNYVSGGVIRGSGMAQAWFWQTPMYIHGLFCSYAESVDAVVTDFRRVK